MLDSDSMRVNLFYPTIDRMLAEMNERFSPQSESVMLGINACNPPAATFLNINDLKKLSSHYSMELFEPEVAVAKNYLQAQQLKSEKKLTMEKAYTLLDPFPTLKKIFQLALNCPCDELLL